MDGKSLIAACLAAASLAAASTPAVAQGHYSPRDMRAEIADLGRDLQYLGSGRELTNSEYRRMANRIAKLDALYARYRRGGFTRAELLGLSSRIDAVRYDMRREANDRHRLRRR